MLLMFYVMNSQFERLETRIDNLSNKIDNVETKVDEVRGYLRLNVSKPNNDKPVGNLKN